MHGVYCVNETKNYLNINQPQFLSSSQTTTITTIVINDNGQNSSLKQNQTISDNESIIKWKHPVLGVVLILFSLITIVGNILVICAVLRERYLKSATNYYIVSLAIADLLVGLVVMPFNTIHEMTNNYWFFGQLWCDLWHSLDVFASTASILSLVVIALDRYSAISDPFNYQTRWITQYWIIFIAVIWICSAGISFPGIAYWRYSSSNNTSMSETFKTPYKENVCTFTDDIYYILFSSLVSFYMPLSVMIFVYIRIYRAATRQMTALKTGRKVYVQSTDGAHLTLRIHRGGYNRGNSNLKDNSFSESVKVPQATTSNGSSKIVKFDSNNDLNKIKNSSMKESENKRDVQTGYLLTPTKYQTDFLCRTTSEEYLNKNLSKLEERISKNIDLDDRTRRYSFDTKNLNKYASECCIYSPTFESIGTTSSSQSSLHDSTRMGRYKSKINNHDKNHEINSLKNESSFLSLRLIKSKDFNKRLKHETNDAKIQALNQIESPLNRVLRHLSARFKQSMRFDETLNCKKIPKIVYQKADDDQINAVSVSLENIKSKDQLTNLNDEATILNTDKTDKNDNVSKGTRGVNFNKNTLDTIDTLDERDFVNTNTTQQYCPLMSKNSKLKKPISNEGDDDLKYSLLNQNDILAVTSIKKLKITKQDSQNIKSAKLQPQNEKQNVNLQRIQNSKIKNNRNNVGSNLEFYHQHYYQHHLELQQAQAIRHYSKRFPNEKGKDNQKHDLNRKITRDRNNSNNSMFSSNSNSNRYSKTELISKKMKSFNITKKLCKFSREQKAAKTLGIVMGVFIICWLPFFIFHVSTAIFVSELTNAHVLIYEIFTWLGYINSGCNPIIYAFSSRDFRRAFYKILCPSSFMRNNQRLATRDCASTEHANNLRLNYRRNVILNCEICQIYERMILQQSSMSLQKIPANATTLPSTNKMNSMNPSINNFIKHETSSFNSCKANKGLNGLLMLNKITFEPNCCVGYHNKNNNNYGDNKYNFKKSLSPNSIIEEMRQRLTLKFYMASKRKQPITNRSVSTRDSLISHSSNSSAYNPNSSFYKRKFLNSCNKFENEYPHKSNSNQLNTIYS